MYSFYKKILVFLLCILAAGLLPINSVYAGTSGPKMLVSISMVTWGNVELGSTSYAQTTSIWNDGDSALLVSGAAIDGDNASDFYVEYGGVITIPPYQCHVMNIYFKPKSTGTRKATLTITSNDPGTPTAAVTLNGTGISAPPPDPTNSGSSNSTNTSMVVHPNSIRLNQGDHDLKAGESEQLAAIVSPADASDTSVSWSSNNNSVLTVDQSGTVTAVKAGGATITAQTNDGGLKASCYIVVPDSPPLSVSLDKKNVSFKVGKTELLSAAVIPSAPNNAVTWSSSNNSVVTVKYNENSSWNSTLTAKSSGTATVTVRTANGKTDTCAITVEPEDDEDSTDDNKTVVVHPKSVRLNTGNHELKLKETEQLAAMVSPDDTTDKSVKWSSSNSSALTVDQSGKVTALAVGGATITAQTNDGGLKASCYIVVGDQASPDLGIGDVAFSHPDLYSPNILRIPVKVKNHGSGAATKPIINIYFNNQKIGSKSLDTIAPGAQASPIIDCTLPTAADIGSLVISAELDGQTDANYSDNQATRPLSFFYVDFRLMRDAFQLRNSEVFGGNHCYGFSSASINYFLWPETKPVNKETYQMSESDIKADILARQDSISQIIGKQIVNLSTLAYNATEQYNKILLGINNISQPRPVLVVVAKSGVDGVLQMKHALVAYKIIDLGDEKRVYVYDCESPGSASCYITFTKNKGSGSYTVDYANQFNAAFALSVTKTDSVKPVSTAPVNTENKNSAGKTIVLNIGDSFMKINNELKEIDPGRSTKPVIISNRTLVPIRTIIEALGGSVSWNELQKKVDLVLGSKQAELWIDKNTISVNGKQQTCDAAPAIINDRTMLPLRSVIEGLGLTVDWDAAGQQVTIRY